MEVLLEIRHEVLPSLPEFAGGRGRRCRTSLSSGVNSHRNRHHPGIGYQGPNQCEWLRIGLADASESNVKADALGQLGLLRLGEMFPFAFVSDAEFILNEHVVDAPKIAFLTRPLQ